MNTIALTKCQDNRSNRSIIKSYTRVQQHAMKAAIKSATKFVPEICSHSILV